MTGSIRKRDGEGVTLLAGQKDAPIVFLDIADPTRGGGQSVKNVKKRESKVKLSECQHKLAPFDKARGTYTCKKCGKEFKITQEDGDVKLTLVADPQEEAELERRFKELGYL